MWRRPAALQLAGTTAMPQSVANFLGGATSGCISTLLLQPLDVVKTRLQVSPHTLTRAPNAGGFPLISLSPPARGVKNPGIIETFQLIIRHDSPLGLWRGVTPTLLRNTLGVGAYFVTLNNLNAILASEDGTLSDRSTLVAGASARSLSVAMLCPLSVVKTRLELAEYSTRYRGVFDALRQISQREGVRGLYSGLTPAIVRDAPYSALFVLIYLKSKLALNGALGLGEVPSSVVATPQAGERAALSAATPGDSRNGKAAPKSKAVGMAVNFVAGAFGGGLATLLTQPQDVVKTRMQVTAQYQDMVADHPQPKPGAAGPRGPRTVGQTIRTVFTEEGFVGFFRGASPRFLKRCLGSAITWMIFEETVRVYAGFLSDSRVKTSAAESRPVSPTPRVVLPASSSSQPNSGKSGSDSQSSRDSPPPRSSR